MLRDMYMVSWQDRRSCKNQIFEVLYPVQCDKNDIKMWVKDQWLQGFNFLERKIGDLTPSPLLSFIFPVITAPLAAGVGNA